MTCNLARGFEAFSFIFVGEQSLLRCLWHSLPVNGMSSHSLDDICSLLKLTVLTLTELSSLAPPLTDRTFGANAGFSHISSLSFIGLRATPRPGTQFDLMVCSVEGLGPRVQLPRSHLLKGLLHGIPLLLCPVNTFGGLFLSPLFCLTGSSVYSLTNLLTL